MAMGAGVWFGDNLMLWLLVFLVGAALPLVLRLVLIGSGAKAA